ncbi:MAG: hypothetical protein DMG10_11970 [Acidobacteria bacterium]|nr:MAG: hypothetical protein DMG10_11970 [Acidobacteriota bacterium]
MTRRVLAVLSPALLFLSGCAVGPRYKRPAAPVAQQWSGEQARGTSTGEPVEQWWLSFNDPEFRSLIERAVKANLDLKLATARIAEARAVRGIAKSGLFPTVEASASATRNRQRVIAPANGAAAIVPVEFNNFQGGFDASWELDVFGRVRRGLQAANADVAAAREARRDVLVAVLGEVGRTYAELRGFQFRLDIAQKNIATQQDTLDLTKSRATAGLATELDVARAAAQLETTRSVVPSLQSGIEISIHRLSVLLGQEPSALRAEVSPTAPVPMIPPEVPVGLRSELLERRPDVRQAEAQIAAATARVGEAKAEWFPRFTLFGSAGRQASQLHEITLGMGNFFSAGPAVSLPIFTGARIRSNIRVQDARLQQVVIGYRSTVLSALEETENALVNYSEEQSRRERLENAVKSNEEAVRLSSELYKAGLTDFLSVLDAQRELYANEDLLAQSRAAQAVNLIALYKALGGGWQSVALP